MKRFIASVIRNTVFVNVALVIILAVGGICSQLLVRELFPEISVDVIGVSIFYPGADPAEVEEGICRKLEEAVDGIEGIKRYRTVSSENHGQLSVEIVEGYDAGQLYTDIRNAVDSISTFPRDAEKPIISEFLIRNEVVSLALWGDQPERVLKEFAEDVKDELQALPGISQVSITGTREYEIGIEISEERLREYGLTFAEVTAAVRRGSLNLAGGQLRTKGEEIRLRTVGRKYSGEDFASIVVLARPDGEIITLGRIASIKDAFTEDEILSTFNGQRAVNIMIAKTTNEDSVAISHQVRDYVAGKQAQIPEGLHVTLWSDRSESIQSGLALLMRNGLIGLAIVFLSLWLLLEFRLSFWVTMGIPVALSGGLLIMWLVGASLNQMSVFGLIMVLGIVVDDAIIIGEAIYVHRKQGEAPLLAATNGVMEVGLPVFAAVSTSIIAFIPLLFVEGVMGKFVAIIPVAVIAALSVSLAESLFLLPGHLNHLPDLREEPGKKYPFPTRIRLGISHGLERFVEGVYLPAMDTVIHFRYVTFCVAVLFLLTTIGLVRGGFVKFIVMPEFDQRDITAAIEFPRGTPGSVTSAAIKQTEEAFLRVSREFPEKDGIPVLRNIQGLMGSNLGEGGFNMEFGNHVGFVRVELADVEDRLIDAKSILKRWEEETGPIPGALVQTFTAMEQGPPGAPIIITLQGEKLDTLLAVAERLKAKLRTFDGVYQVGDSYRPGKKELQISLKPEARTLGLTVADLANQVYAGYFGEEAVRLQRGRDDIRVRVRYTEDQRRTLADLEQVRIRTPQGHEVPFFSVADVSFGKGLSNIMRVDGYVSVSVTAENDSQRANPDEVLADVKATELPLLEEEFPGFTWTFEGPKKDANDAIGGLARSFPIALIGIFIVIATIFRSYVQPLLIMVTVPFGIIGGVWAHWAMGVDLAMFSIFGMVALTGVVVNDAIVLVEAVNTNIANGMEVFEAIRRGGARRFRAIILTTTSTVGGLLPLILQSEGGGEVVVGMALSMAGGVAFATVLTLVYVPCLLGILNDFRRAVYWLFHQKWPTREEVEPARLRNIDPLAEGEGEAVTVN